jgi:hypothetical protein
MLGDLFAWLGDLLLGILCAVIAGIVYAVNFLIEALGALVALLVALLPAMPSLPTMPTEVVTVLAWVNWFFPVGTVVQFFAFIITVWLLWQGVAIGLRWAKAVRE